MRQPLLTGLQPQLFILMFCSSCRTAVALRHAVALAMTVTGLLACSGAEPSDSSPTPTEPTPSTPGASVAVVASLDSTRLPVPAGAIIDPGQQWETNAALYFLVADPAAALSNGGSTIIKFAPSGSVLQTSKTPVYASAFRPTSETSDGATGLSTLWVSTPALKSGALSLLGGGSTTTDFAVTGDLHEIIPDRSSTSREWATGLDANARWQVVRKSAVVGAKWATVARPAELGTMTTRAVGMPNGKLYLGVGGSMYVIADNGIERTIPMVLFESGPLAVVNKVVGANGGTSVYIGYGTKILRLSTSDGQLSEVMTTTMPNPLGSFCVNSGRVYTNAGMKSALNEIGAPASYIQTTTNVSSADQARLSRIKALLLTGAPMCLNEGSTINASVFIASGGWLYRVGSV